MTPIRVSAALVCFATLLIAGCATTSEAPQATVGTARIKALSGNADVARPGRDWAPAHLWQKLSAGDRARTGGNGTIDFNLGKYGGVLTLMPESAIEFEQIGPLSPNAKIVAVINLLEGRVVGDSLRLPENTHIQVKTRNGVHEIP